MNVSKSHLRIIAIELTSDMPRRKASLPHLYVGLTSVSVEERFINLQKGAGPKGLLGKHLKIRQDLLGTSEVFENPRTAKANLRHEKNRLTKLGYAINGIATAWHSYVVDLDPVGMTDVGKGYVYVGQTSHTPEERYSIHKGPKPAAPATDLRSKVVHKRGIGLNYELMKKLTPESPVFTQADALRLEKTWAKKLHGMGYRVEAGEATPGRKASKKVQ